MTDSLCTAQSAPEDRPIRQSLWRGWQRKCPKCGEGKSMHSYLKVHDECSVCGTELFHHKADDGPAYLTILIVGHLVGVFMHIYFVQFRPEPLEFFAVFAVGCTALSLYLLPRLKGAIVAYQWARRMNGFETAA